MNINENEVSDELLEQAKACKTQEELIELAMKSGVELSDDQLDSMAGGSWYDCESFERNCSMREH